MIWLSKVSCHLLAYQVAPVSYLDLRGVQAGEQSAGSCLHFPDLHMKLQTFQPETSPVLLDRSILRPENFGLLYLSSFIPCSKA